MLFILHEYNIKMATSSYKIDLPKIYLLGVEIKIISASMAQELTKIGKKINEVTFKAIDIFVGYS